MSFFFGGEIRRSLDKPVGLIQSAAGGTPIQTWISEQPLKAMPIYQTLLEDWIALQGKNSKTEDEPDSNDKPRISPKSLPFSSPRNGMIAPLAPYAIRGAIWYQGEATPSTARLLWGASPQDLDRRLEIAVEAGFLVRLGSTAQLPQAPGCSCRGNGRMADHSGTNAGEIFLCQYERA